MKKCAVWTVCLMGIGMGTLYAESTCYGDLRLGLEHQKGSQGAFGGSLGMGQNLENGFYFTLGVHTTQSLFADQDAEGIPFLDADGRSYTILDDATLGWKDGENSLIIGRQALDTPFLDSDDIGMVPNRFEAISLMHGQGDVALTLSWVRRMSGVDAPDPRRFSKLVPDEGVLLAGFTQRLESGVEWGGWYYRLGSDSAYSYGSLDFSYDHTAWHAQLAYQKRDDAEDTTIYGVAFDADFAPFSISLGYDRAHGSAAENGFGGGPYFVNMEHLTLFDAGEDAQMYRAEIGVDLSEWLSGLEFYGAKALLRHNNAQKGSEFDATLTYRVSKQWSLHAVYSNIDDDAIDTNFENIRLYIERPIEEIL